MKRTVDSMDFFLTILRLAFPHLTSDKTTLKKKKGVRLGTLSDAHTLVHLKNSDEFSHKKARN